MIPPTAVFCASHLGLQVVDPYEAGQPQLGPVALGRLNVTASVATTITTYLHWILCYSWQIDKIVHQVWR